MKLEMKRFVDDGDTSGTLFYIDGKFECFMVEDEQRTVKVFKETRIPESVLEVSIRKEGRINARYTKKYDWHKGMLCLHNAPNWKIIVGTTVFQYCMFHIGNDEDDTAGCPLPNETFNSTRMVGAGSGVAYKKMYLKIVNHLLAGNKVFCHISKIGA